MSVDTTPRVDNPVAVIYFIGAFVGASSFGFVSHFWPTGPESYPATATIFGVAAIVGLLWYRVLRQRERAEELADAGGEADA